MGVAMPVTVIGLESILMVSRDQPAMGFLDLRDNNKRPWPDVLETYAENTAMVASPQCLFPVCLQDGGFYLVQR